MFTDQEILNMINRTLALCDNKSKAQKVFHLKDEDFYPFMMGYLQGELQFVKGQLELNLKIRGKKED